MYDDDYDNTIILILSIWFVLVVSTLVIMYFNI